MPSIKDKITEDMKNAMRAGEKEKLGAIRQITAAFKQIEVDERIEINDDRALLILDKLLKQRRESISQFESGGRDDLVAIEQFEAGIIQSYMPTPLNDTEIDTIIQGALKESGAESMKDMGKLMAIIKPQCQGRADMSIISKKIKDRITNK